MNVCPLAWRRLVTYMMLALGVAACATPAPSEQAASSPSVTPQSVGATRRAAVPPPRIDNWQAERQRIQSELSPQTEISLNTTDDGALRILIPGADAFGKDNPQPAPKLRATLDRVAAALAPRKETEIFVIGHTDSLGSELYNLQLSIKRAEAVVDYLRTRGIALTRLHADGKGEAEPIADNGHDAGRAKNRRVEIVVRPFN